jgi:hypothetical protein
MVLDELRLKSPAGSDPMVYSWPLVCAVSGLNFYESTVNVVQSTVGTERRWKMIAEWHRRQAISQDFMLGGVRESMGVQTKSGSAETGARDFLFGGVQFTLRGVHPPMGGLGISLIGGET